MSTAPQLAKQGPEFQIEEVGFDSPMLEAVVKLHATSKSKLGPFPMGAFEDHARQKLILIAVSNDKSVAGYLLYRVARRARRASIVHLTTGERFRGKSPAFTFGQTRRNSTVFLPANIISAKGRQIRFASLAELHEFLGHLKKLRRADLMFREGVVTSIVSKFDEFVAVVIKVAFEQNYGWLKNPEKKISYKELLEIRSLDSLKADIVLREVDALMRDSHYNQVTFLDSKLKLGIEEHFPRWGEFLEITERRNLYVHAGGCASGQYLNNCKLWKVSIADTINENTYLPADEEYIKNAADCFYELAVRICQASVRRLFPQSFEDADRLLNNETVELFAQERWALGEQIFEYALGIPADLMSKGEYPYYFLLNLCIALKFGGKPFDKRLHAVDWKPFHPKYHFAVAVLEDRFDDAETLMRSEVVHSAIEKDFFKTWPLLKEFRKSTQFENAFRDIFQKDLKSELLEDAKSEIEAQTMVEPKVVTSDAALPDPHPLPPKNGDDAEA